MRNYKITFKKFNMTGERIIKDVRNEIEAVRKFNYFNKGKNLEIINVELL